MTPPYLLLIMTLIIVLFSGNLPGIVRLAECVTMTIRRSVRIYGLL